MKRLMVTVFLVLGLVIMTAPMAMALQLQIGYKIGSIISSYGPYQTGSGGEFTVKPLDGLEWVLGFYNSNSSTQTRDIGVLNTFQTFCLEMGEHISGYPSTYNVVLNDRAMNGGVVGPPPGDPISKGTAWLYHEFQNGTLAVYDYTNPGRSGSGSSADLLQRTIWYLEDEGGSVTNVFTAALITKFGSIANAKLDNNGAYSVAAMNLTASDGRHQDLLVCVPEPFTLLFLGGCLVSAVIASRKFKSLKI